MLKLLPIHPFSYYPAVLCLGIEEFQCLAPDPFLLPARQGAEGASPPRNFADFDSLLLVRFTANNSQSSRCYLAAATLKDEGFRGGRACGRCIFWEKQQKTAKRRRRRSQ